jgi:hypothetical protein
MSVNPGASDCRWFYLLQIVALDRLRGSMILKFVPRRRPSSIR